MILVSQRWSGMVLLRACLIAVSFAGCARRAATPQPVIVPSVAAAPYRVQAGDVVEVRFRYHPDENQRLQVQADGNLSLNLAHDVEAAGLTTDSLADVIRVRSARYLRDPLVNVVVVSTVARAYIGGEVGNAGFVGLSKPVTVLQAVLERGGFTAGADLENIAVISKGRNDQRTMRRVNVGKLAGDQPVDALLLAADDVVVVPKTGIASANLVVEQWIDGLTPQLLKGVRIPTGSSGR